MLENRHSSDALPGSVFERESVGKDMELSKNFELLLRPIFLD